MGKLNGNSQWWDVLAAQQKDMFSLQGYKELKKGAEHVYGLLTGDRETVRKH